MFSTARPYRTQVLLWAFMACGWVAMSSPARGHGISESSRAAMSSGSLLDYVWLGAEHMITGYDHLLFLFGVIFFLTSVRDIVRFITAFTLGHCITLLSATLLGISANAWLIDAVIALSVVYKGFENLDGFERFLKRKGPDLLVMVFVFGLIHGFGLSTRLQELPLGSEGLVGRILAFNVGVELGQVAALTLMLGFFGFWRSAKSFAQFDRVANTLLCLAGGGLFVYQVAGFTGVIVEDHEDHGHHDDHEDDLAPAEDDHGHGHGGHDHGHEPDRPTKPAAAAAAPANNGHDHGHGHGHDAAPPAEPKPEAVSSEDNGHDHGHGHGHDAAPPTEPAPAATAPAAPAAPADNGHDHGHGHGHGGQ